MGPHSEGAKAALIPNVTKGEGTAVNPAAERPDGPTEKIRKPYAKPSLQIFGDVRELTQLHGATGSPDGSTTGSGFINKTS
jgi:hypothetical protein